MDLKKKNVTTLKNNTNIGIDLLENTGEWALQTPSLSEVSSKKTNGRASGFIEGTKGFNAKGNKSDTTISETII